MDIREMLRHLRQKQSNRAVAQALGVNRKTVARYRAWAAEQGLLAGSLPSPRDLQRLLDETMNCPPPPQNESSVGPFADLVRRMRGQGVEIVAIHQRLRERGYTGSYASVYRFVRQLEPPAPDVMARVETRPGEEAQVDWGSFGKIKIGSAERALSWTGTG